MKEEIRVVGFDADDTLWINETYYRESEHRFAELMQDFGTEKEIMDALFRMEMKNLEAYGYGIKSFVLSMVETCLEIAGDNASQERIGRIIALGKEMLAKPVQLLPRVKEVLEALKGRYTLIVATKGDLLDQERKLKNSSLVDYFHHIEIMSEKAPENYRSLLQHLDLEPSAFMMIGNSVKSDVLPPLELGCYAVHVPFHTTWIHEMNAEKPVENERFREVAELNEVLEFLL